MKILHVITTMDPRMGGVSQAVRSIVAGMSGRAGFVNEVVSLDAADSDFLADDLFPVHALGPSKGPWSYCPALRGWLMENLRRFDVVIAHGLWQYQSFALSSCLKALGEEKSLPDCWVMPHGMLDPYFQKAAGRRIKALRNTICWKICERYLVNRARGILFTCEDEMRLARQPFDPYRPREESVVGLGVEEPPEFDERMEIAFRRACPETGDRPYFLFLSRIHEKKGVDLMIKAYAKLFSQRAGKLPDLVIAGPLDSVYAEEMRSLAAELLPEGGKIHFPGMLKGDAKYGAFYGCEVFVLPSHQENFGIAVVEALACGKPVLISDKVNIWREISDGGAGLVSADTEEEVGVLLHRWISVSGDERAEMSRAARAAYKEKFTIPRGAERLLAAVGK